ncbi:MAG: zf-HC2 domain-containing protein [Planctomycetes bacterium]|nr:zf-HC2 domain-containing protein [Planctomycetota bacterium]
MNCESVLDGLSALLDGALPAPDRAAVEGHLAACASCRSRRAELDEVRLLLRSLEDADALAPAGVRERVMAALAAPPARRQRSVLPLVIAGTVLGVLVAAPVALHLVKRSTPRPIAAAPRETPKKSEPAKIELPAPTPVWTPPPLPDPDPPPPEPVRPPPRPQPEPSPPLAGATERVHLEAVVEDPAVLAALEALLADYPGTVDSEPLDAGAGLHGLSADMEGTVSAKTSEFTKKLLAFQQEHLMDLRKWRMSSGTR